MMNVETISPPGLEPGIFRLSRQLQPDAFPAWPWRVFKMDLNCPRDLLVSILEISIHIISRVSLAPKEEKFKAMSSPETGDLHVIYAVTSFLIG